MPRLINLPTGTVVDVSPELAATLGPSFTPFEPVDEPADENPDTDTPESENSDE